MKKKLCCILMLILLFLNSSMLIVISEAINAVQEIIASNENKVLAEINLIKYQNFNTTENEANSNTGSKGTIAQFNLKTGVQFGKDMQYQPIDETNITIKLPLIGNYKPIRVEVITKSTQATNGGKEAKYQYNSSTGILDIIAENKEYSENIAEARDEYEIICIYGSECYSENEARNLKINANIKETLKDKTSISTKVDGDYDVKENINEIISVEHKTEDIYDGYIKANEIDSENQYETTYKETEQIMISNKEIAQKIEIKETSETSLYTETNIDKNQVKDILGENGSIEILDESGEIISTINKDTETDENGKIKITYANRKNTLNVCLNNIEKEGIIELENSRVIISTAKIINNTISTEICVNGTNEIINEEKEDNTKKDCIKYKYNQSILTEIKEATSNIDTKLSTDVLVNNTTNDIILTTTLKTKEAKDSLFENPYISIEMPKEVTNVKLGISELMYDNKIFKIVNTNVSKNENENKIINIQLEGKQTSYENETILDGTTIRIPMTVTVTKNMENKVGTIKIICSNKMTEKIESKEIEVNLLNKVVNIKTKVNNAMIIDSTEKNNNTSSEITKVYEKDGIKAELIEEIGRTPIENNGTIYEEQIIKYVLKVTNTSNIEQRVKLDINVPNEMVYVVRRADDGFLYHEDGNYYELHRTYEYDEKNDKQVPIEVKVKPGEEKSDYIELKVKDLNANEQERQTSIDGDLYINEIKKNKLSINNNIKQAEVKVFLQCVLNTEKHEYGFILDVENLTNRNLKKLNVEFEADEMFNINEVISETNGKLENLSGNMWQYTIELLNANEKEHCSIIGIVGEIPESENNKYKIKGDVTVTGDDINTYISNEAWQTGYIESIEPSITSDKDTLRQDEEITYTVNIKNTGGTWKGFAIYTDVNIKDVIPRELTPISMTYNKFTIHREGGRDENGNEIGYESQTYTEEQVTTDLSVLNIPDGYDKEDAPNIDLDLQIPEGKTVIINIKAKAKMITDTKEITNIVNVTGKEIKSKVASVKTTVLKYNIDEKPDNPNKPENPSKPENPDNTNVPSNPDNPKNEKITISGIAWIDENEDGKRTTNEKVYSNMPIMLYDYNNMTFVKENGQDKKIMTNEEGKYEFNNIEKGKYIIIFLYDIERYTLTEYKKEGVIESKNSDTITKNVVINGNEITAGLTDTLIADTDLTNIDIGLVENKKFDLGIQKYISKITVQTSDGKTKVYDYNDKQFAKIEIHSKKINGATVIIEYKMVVTNKGELTGKAVQIVDKLPEGLTFKSELNNEWYERNGNLYTNSLSGEDINIGESKEVKLILAKNVNSNNVGTINNTVEIGISNNNKAVEDENKENDTSNAQVLLGVSTGLAKSLGITFVIILLTFVMIVLILKNKKILKIILVVFLFAICLVGKILPTEAHSSNDLKNYSLWIKGKNMRQYPNSTAAIGSDGRSYTCSSAGVKFCDRWHGAIENTSARETSLQSTGEWSSASEINLTDKTSKENLKFQKIDNDYNKFGPFKVDSNIASASKTITITYIDVNGKQIEESAELIDWGWGQDFYVKIPNNVKYIVKLNIIAEYKTTVRRTNTYKEKRTYWTYACHFNNGSTISPYGGSKSCYDPNCDGGNTQNFITTITYSRKEDKNVTKNANIDINGPWTPTGDLEIKKVDLDNNENVLKNTEFKFAEGTNQNRSLIIYKDNQKVNKITIENNITFNQKKSIYGTTPSNTSNVTIDGKSGYTAIFKASLNDGTTLVTNSNGIVLFKNLICGQYTFIETGNQNYGYSKMVTVTKDSFSAVDKTIWEIKNEKQVGDFELKKIDDRVESKVLPGVEFALKSSYKDNWIKVKGTGSKVTTDNNGWVTKAIGNIKINDTNENDTNPVIEYVSTIEEATKFVTDENGSLLVQNLLMSSNGTDKITYQLLETDNPNYGYLVYENGVVEMNHGVTWEGNSVTESGEITIKRNDKISTTAKNHQDYIRIEGYVWEEIANSKDNAINNLYDEGTDALIEGLKVYLCKDNNIVAQTVTNSEGWYEFGTKKEDGSYTNKDYLTDANGNLKIDDLDRYNIEFEYDGLRFTSIEAIIDYKNENYERTSKATEVPNNGRDRKDRATVNDEFAIISNNQANNSKGSKTYDLSYDTSVNHVSTYIDKWGYEYNEGKTRLKVTQPKENRAYQIIASTKQSGFKIDEAWKARCENVGAEVLTGINLGIKRREQNDLAIASDLTQVNITVRNSENEVYDNTYTYAKREIDGNAEIDNFGVDVKFGTANGNYSSRGLNIYTRRVYESDLALENKNSGFMQVYVTYKIRIKNQSNDLGGKIIELANYYDERYEISSSWIADSKGNKISDVSWGTNKYGKASTARGYKVAYTSALAGNVIESGKYQDVYIKFKLNQEAVKALIQKQTTLNNVSEINAFSTIKDGKSYAAIDQDSNPGNAEIKIGDTKTSSETLNNRTYQIENTTLETDSFEDDTDLAPALIMGLEVEEPTRGLSGTVFEDSNTKGENPNATNTGEERIGNGIFDTNENLVKNAIVELLEYDADAEDNIAKDAEGNAKLATLYKLSVTGGSVTTNTEPARVTTGDEGTYEFLGVLPGRYLIRYTYNNETTINGNPIDPRDYKSTIITSDIIQHALAQNNSGVITNAESLNWILTYDEIAGNGNEEPISKSIKPITRYSDAVDDLDLRYDQEKDGIYNGNIEDPNGKMTADTAGFDVGVEYSKVSEVKQEGFNERVSFTDYKDEYNLENGKIVAMTDEGKIKLLDTFYAVNPCQDFGIIERPRQVYEVNKRISYMKLTLASGQTIINGNPYQQIPDAEVYKKWDQLESTANGDSALPYTKALPSQVVAEIDNEIIQGATLEIEYTISIKNDSEKDYEYKTDPSYYYYGKVTNQQEVKSVIKKVVDYMDDEMMYNEENDKIGWTKVTAEQLSKYKEDGTIKEKQLISDDVKNGVDNGYVISINNNIDKIELAPKGVASFKIYGSKLLSNTEKGKGFKANNHVEIVETKRKIKDVTPGNYNPSAGNGSPNEADDDKTSIIITQPTGLTDSRVFVISMAMIILVIFAGEIYWIKKKVLE